MPSVAAWDAAGAMSATAHAASKVVLIRIRAPGEELGSGGMLSGPPHEDGTVGSPTVVRGPRRNTVRISRPRAQPLPSEDTRQPSFTGTSSTVSCEGAWPDADVRTSAVALFSSL